MGPAATALLWHARGAPAAAGRMRVQLDAYLRHAPRCRRRAAVPHARSWRARVVGWGTTRSRALGGPYVDRGARAASARMRCGAGCVGRLVSIAGGGGTVDKTWMIAPRATAAGATHILFPRFCAACATRSSPRRPGHAPRPVSRDRPLRTPSSAKQLPLRRRAWRPDLPSCPAPLAMAALPAQLRSSSAALAPRPRRSSRCAAQRRVPRCVAPRGRSAGPHAQRLRRCGALCACGRV